MNERGLIDDVADLQEELSLKWDCEQPGLRCGIDNEVDAVITLHAPRVLRWLDPGASLPALPGMPPVNGLRDVVLSFSLGRLVEVQPWSAMEADHRSWKLPDMDWTQSVSVALRLRVPAAVASGVGTLVPLARAKLTATAVLSDGAQQSTLRLVMPLGLAVLSDEEWDANLRELQQDRCRWS